MSAESLRTEILRAIIDAGFTPYMRDRTHSFAFFTDGINIGCLEENRMDGLSIRTVHKANRSSGTGFGIAQGLMLADLTPETLKRAFAKLPDWHCRDESSVRKYRDMAEFLAYDSWHTGFKPVTLADLS